MINKKLFFDGLALVDGHFSGVGQYTLGVLRGIDDYLEKERLVGRITPEVRVIIPRDCMQQFYNFGFKNIYAVRFPLKFITMARLWHRNLLPPLDIFFGPGYYVFMRFVDMRLAFSKSAIVIYDLSYENYRQFSDEKNAKFLAKQVSRSIKNSDMVFTISQNSKREIAEFYDFPKHKIAVASPAADQRYFYRRSPQEIEKIKQKYGIKKDYILSLSNLEPRKNLGMLVDAYCNLPKHHRDNTSLLLVGVSGWKTNNLFQKIISRVQEGYDIIRPNAYVSDCDKPALISGAKMLVYPSHYEGFGMPPLEALACGVPVIASNNSSLPEAVGSAGKMLDCNDVDGFTESMKSYLDDIDEVTKQSIKKGREQASNFSWEKTAQVYIDNILESNA